MERITQRLLNFLDENLNKINNQVDCINCGGCGVFAYLLACELDELGIDYKIAYLDHPSYDFQEKTELFNSVVKSDRFSNCELNNNGIRCVHMVVEVDNKYIDSKGVYDDYRPTIYCETELRGYITLEQCKYICFDNDDDVNSWNSNFNRNDIPVIQEFISDTFENFQINYS